MQLAIGASLARLRRTRPRRRRRSRCLGALMPILAACLLALSPQASRAAPAIGRAHAGEPARLAPSAEQAELLRLADAAKAAFRRRMEPPAAHLNVLDIAVRDSTAVFRDHARESFEAAIDALLAEATTPERTRAVAAALRKFVRTGDDGDAATIFTEILDRTAAEGGAANRAAAAAARHSVALVELPAALAPLINRPDEPLPFAPLGQKALPAYLRAAELDPGDAWTWIVLSQFARDDQAFELAIGNAVRAAQAAGDLHAQIAAQQVRAFLNKGRPAEAEQAHLQALALARRWAASDPAALRAQRDLASSLNRLGDMQSGQGRRDEAAAAYREALEIRRRLAAADPEDARRQIDLIASHIKLALLAGGTGEDEEARTRWAEAFRLYEALAARDRFDPLLDPFQSGAAVQILLFAGSLTLVLGLALLARYRRVVARWMKAAAAASRAQAGVPPEGAAAGRPTARAPEFPVRALDASRRTRRMAWRSEAVAGARRASRRAAWAYALAGFIFAMAGAGLWLRLADIDITWPRWFLVTWAWAWPVVLTLALLWGPDRRRLGLLLFGYFGVLTAFCVRVAMQDTPPLEAYGLTVPPFFQPLLFWASNAVASLFLLAFLNRRVRAVGPVLIVFMIVLGVGALSGMVVQSTFAVLKALSTLAAGLNPLVSLLILPAAGMLLAAPLAWWSIGRLRRHYDAKRASDQTLVFDSIWLFQSLNLCSATVHAAGPWGWLALGCFAVYRLIVWVGLKPLREAAAARRPARLLLLRTFGFRRRTERFFDVLGARWRYAGPIQLIAAPDLAGRSIGPDKFLDFLSGRLRHRFIIEPRDLDRRFAEMDDRPDPDGRYRVNEFFCGNDAWQPAVRRLMAESDLVAMDLRGFSPKNQGCLFELQSLIDMVPVARIVLLADRTTDAAYLRRTLAEGWQRMDAASPNRDDPGALCLLELGRSNVAAVQALLSIADAALAQAPASVPRTGAVAAVAPAR